MSGDISIDQNEIDSLLGFESPPPRPIPVPAASPEKKNKPLHTENISYQTLTNDKAAGAPSEIALVGDIPLELSVELGRTKRSIADILDFGIGTVVELTRLAGEPVDLMANGKLIAKGEVVVIDENFALRITDIISQKAKKES